MKSKIGGGVRRILRFVHCTLKEKLFSIVRNLDEIFI